MTFSFHILLVFQFTRFTISPMLLSAPVSLLADILLTPQSRSHFIQFVSSVRVSHFQAAGAAENLKYEMGKQFRLVYSHTNTKHSLK